MITGKLLLQRDKGLPLRSVSSIDKVKIALIKVGKIFIFRYCYVQKMSHIFSKIR
jgi:hypothetical protein